jgi:hypothetical protein
LLTQYVDQVPCALCTSKGIECHPRHSRRADTSANGSEHRRRNTNSSRLNNAHKRPNVSSKNSTIKPAGEHESMFGLFDSYEIDLGNPELASGYSTSSSSNMLSADSQVAQHSSTINADTASVENTLLDSSYFDSSAANVIGGDFEPYPAWDPMLMDGHLLDTSLLNSEDMKHHFSTGLAPMPTQQMPHYYRASSEQAPTNKTPSIHPVDSVIDMSHSSPHTRTHSPIQAAGSDASNSALDGIKPRVITFQNLYDDDVITIVQDSWAGFRCNQNRPDLPSFQTTSMHLKGLAEMLHSQDVWDRWPVPVIDKLEPISSSHITCRPVSSQTRDKMSSMFQSMLQTTFHSHGLSGSPSMPPDSSETSWDDRLGASRMNSYVVLPPTKILESFLRSYTNRIEHLYPSVCGGEIRPNSMLANSRNPEIPALLLLLMIAAGATGSGRRDSFYFTNGLTEICRVNLWQLSEHNAELRSDLAVLRCTLLLTILAAWSGDKCQMDASMGNRAVYLNMLTRSGLLNHQSYTMSLIECRTDTNDVWQQWKTAECGKRYVLVDPLQTHRDSEATCCCSLTLN